MKYKIKATENANLQVGNIKLKAKKGKTLTVTATEAEVALGSGKFELAEKEEKTVNKNTDKKPTEKASKEK